MANLVKVATKEFADTGPAGAGIDQIAAAASRTSKRMIYDGFTNKEGLSGHAGSRLPPHSPV